MRQLLDGFCDRELTGSAGARASLGDSASGDHDGAFLGEDQIRPSIEKLSRNVAGVPSNQRHCCIETLLSL